MSKSEEMMQEFKEEWEKTYAASLREKLVCVCNNAILSPSVAAIAQSLKLDCSNKEIVVKCLRQLADDIEKNTLVIR